jgi:hypothetical protein
MHITSYIQHVQDKLRLENYTYTFIKIKIKKCARKLLINYNLKEII